MHKFQLMPVGVAMIAIIAALPQLKATAVPATTAILNEAPAATVEWIDPAILKQLQAIEPIDRSKYKFDTQQLAQRIGSVMQDVKIVKSNSKQAIPELTAPDRPVIVATGKTRYPTEMNGKTYPPGLHTEVVYDSYGVPISAQIARPLTPEDFTKSRFQ
jgi:hypothetical protein